MNIVYSSIVAGAVVCIAYVLVVCYAYVYVVCCAFVFVVVVCWIAPCTGSPFVLYPSFLVN